MIITIVTTLMMMAAYFLLLYAGVAYIQDKKFFSSAPKEIVDAIPDRKERFKGAHTIGWVLIAVAFLTFARTILVSSVSLSDLLLCYMVWRFLTLDFSTGNCYVIQTFSLDIIRK